MVQVVRQAIQEHGRKFDLSNDRVAAPAQQPAHSTGHMAVVNDQLAIRGVAQQAAVALLGAELVDLRGCEAVLAHEARSEVLGSRCVGIASAPLAETLVSPRAVRGSVLAIPLADARSTLATPQPPVRELGLLSLDLANPALHVAQHSAVAWHGSTLDQPCHADVLLDLVNEAVPV